MFVSVLSMSSDELRRHTERMLEVHAYFEGVARCQQQGSECELSDTETESYDDCGCEDEEWEHVDGRT